MRAWGCWRRAPGVHAQHSGHGRGRRLGILGDDGEVGGDLQLDLIEAVPGAFGDPANLAGRLLRGSLDRSRTHHARGVVEVDRHDVCDPPSHSQDPGRPAADHDRRPGAEAIATLSLPAER